MDRLSSHGAAVRRLMERHAELSRRADRPGVESALVADPDGRFLLLEVGWAHGRRVNNVYLHVHLRDGKIWVEEDWKTGSRPSWFSPGFRRKTSFWGFNRRSAGT